jgi:succinoglycan biosynthesis transport protein ExoP
VEDRSAPGVLEALWRYKWSSLALAVLLAFISAGVSLMLHRQDVTAQARMALATPRSDNVIGVAITSEPSFVRYTKQRALYATSDPVLARAAEDLNGTTADDLRRRVDATASSDGDAVVVTATADTADRAVEICNAVVRAYQDETLSDVAKATQAALNAITQTREQLKKSLPTQVKPGQGAAQAETTAAAQTLSELAVKASDIRVEATIFGSGVSFVDPATVATATQGQLPIREGALGLVFGALLAATVAWLRADRDRRVREPEGAADLLQAPPLGEVPEVARDEQAALNDLTAMPSVAYQFVASSLQAAISAGLVLVTSAQRGEGRTTAAAHVAIAAARDGVRVLLIDADGSSRRLSALFGLEQERRGLTALTDRETSLDECTYSVTLAEDQTFWVVPAGEFDQSTPSLFRSSAMAKAVLEMRSKYDLVVVDAAPLTISAEAAALARHADGVLVVVRRGATVRALRRLAQQLSLFVAPIVGYVFTFGLPNRARSRAAQPPTPISIKPS